MTKTKANVVTQPVKVLYVERTPEKTYANGVDDLLSWAGEFYSDEALEVGFWYVLTLTPGGSILKATKVEAPK